MSAAPMKLRCGDCEHVFTVCYMPIDVAVLVTLTRKARCAKCGGRKLFIYAPSAQES